MNVFATHNSLIRQFLRCFYKSTLVAVFGCALAHFAYATEGRTTTRADWLAHAQKVYVSAKARYESDPTNTIAAWKFARATFDRAEFATNDTERAALAVQGIDATRQALARVPKSAEAHLYLGMNLGQFARTKLLGALKLVTEMEREFKAAAELDEHLDHAAPDRNLGLLYFQAPSFGSIGSKTKARYHLQRAVILAPDYPENRLSLAEAYAKWGDKKLFQQEMKAIEKLWPSAKSTFTGPDWDSAWDDWERRFSRLKTKEF